MWLMRVLEALMWHVSRNGPLLVCMFCFPNVRHVIILQRSVYFNSSYTRPYVRIIPERSKGANSPPTFTGNILKHIQAKRVYLVTPRCHGDQKTNFSKG